MPRRVNPVIIVGLVAVSVLLFALSAGAAPVESTTPVAGVAPPGGAPENDVAPGEGVGLGEVSGPEEGDVPNGGAEPDKGAAPEDTSSDEESAPGRDVAAEPGAAPRGEEWDAQVEVPEETVKTFEEMRAEAEAADGEYKNARFEEGRLNNEIAQTRSDLAAAETSLEDAQDNLEEQATQMYKHGQSGFMGVLLEAKDFREFANLLGFWVQLLKDDQDKVQEWRESKSELEQATEDLETQLQSWEQTREKAATQKELAQTRMEEAQDYVESLPVPQQAGIEEEHANDSAEALDHAEKLLIDASQKRSAEGAESSGENAGSERGQEERSDDMTRQAEVQQAVAETIREWPQIKEQLEEGTGGDSKLPDEGVGEKTPGQNPAVEQLTAAAEKKAVAEEEASKVPERVASEKRAADEAARARQAADEAEKARQEAGERANPAEQEKLRIAAEEAKLQANFATDQANQEKLAAEELATQAADKLNAADKEFADAQNAAGKITPFATDPLAPGLDPAGNPSSPGSGGGVLGEAKSWMGVPYDYSHRKGQTRAGVDCSAFTAAVFSKFGIALPDSPAGQMGMGTPVSGPPKAGDLVFWSEDGSGVPTHVGIANGDGTTTHSSSFTGEVSVTPMKYIPGYLGARRLL